MPNVLSQRDLVSRPDYMDETVPHIQYANNIIIIFMNIGETMRNLKKKYLKTSGVYLKHYFILPAYSAKVQT